MRIIFALLLLVSSVVGAATDPFQGQSSVQSSAVNGFAVTPNDSTDLSIVPKAVLVGGSGVLRCTLLQMTDGTYLDLPVFAGFNPLRCKRVWSTGTSATNIFGLY